MVNIYRSNFNEAFEDMVFHSKLFWFVAVDTEFIGTRFNTKGLFQKAYDGVVSNVNSSKCIQIRIYLFNEAGVSAPFVWQFNFEFDKSTDVLVPLSINMVEKYRIDFERSQFSRN